jgi:hypothetical protein
VVFVRHGLKPFQTAAMDSADDAGCVALNSNNVDSSRVCILANKIAFILLQVFE